MHDGDAAPVERLRVDEHGFVRSASNPAATLRLGERTHVAAAAAVEEAAADAASTTLAFATVLADRGGAFGCAVGATLPLRRLGFTLLRDSFILGLGDPRVL